MNSTFWFWPNFVPLCLINEQNQYNNNKIFTNIAVTYLESNIRALAVHWSLNTMRSDLTLSNFLYLSSKFECFFSIWEQECIVESHTVLHSISEGRLLALPDLIWRCPLKSTVQGEGYRVGGEIRCLFFYVEKNF